MYKGLGAFLTFFICLPIVASAEFEDDKPLSTVENNQEVYASYLRSAVWSDTSIPVCWENPSEEYSDQMSLIETSIGETWERYSKLDFTGWNKCPRNFVGIRILIADLHPHVKGLGSALDGKRNGMVLNFEFGFIDNEGNQPFSGCKSNGDFHYNTCVRSIAVHEFGHAIGMAHEHNRTDDRPESCIRKPQGATGDYDLTPYDPDSVMNYCNPIYNNNGKLSYRDVVALQIVYGKP